MALYVDIFEGKGGRKAIPLAEFNRGNFASEEYPSGIAYERKEVKEAPVEAPAPVVEVVDGDAALANAEVQEEFEALKEIGFKNLKADQRKRYSELKEICESN